MGIYRDNLSPIIVIALLIYRLLILLLQYILSPTNYRDKRFFMHTAFKVAELALRKKFTVSIKPRRNLR